MTVRPAVLATLVSLLLVAAPAGAQATTHLVAGVASARLRQAVAGDGIEPVDARRGLAVGIGLRRGIGAGFSLAPELLYLTKGGDDPTSDASLAFRYLELPLLLRLDLGTGRTLAPFVAAGPAIAYLASCKLTDGAGGSESCDAVFGPSESYASIDVGVMAMLGLQVRRAALAVRYEHGWRDVGNGAALEARHRTLLVTLAVDL